MALSSCSSFLEEYSQDQAQVETWQDLDELLLGDGYWAPSKFQTSSGDINSMFPMLHFMTDELKQNENVVDETQDLLSYKTALFPYYTWQQTMCVDEDFEYVTGDDSYWNSLYKHINTTNMVLSLIDEQPAPTADDLAGRERVKGEALFLRALYYFTLVNLYGAPYDPSTAATAQAVPVKLTEYVEDKEYVRNTVAEVYEQILADLTEAEKCLDGKERKSVYHANQTAAYLLHSRVCLYMQNWADAAKYARLVLDRQSSLLDLSTLAVGDNSLSKDSPETIFSTGGYLISNIFADYKSYWGYRIEPYFLISDDMMQLYSAVDDYRSQLYVGQSEKYAVSPVFTKVSGQRSTWGSYQEVSDCFLFRTPEAYLTLAEASAYAGDEATARTTLEQFLRTRRVTGSAVTESGHALIDLIRDERAREFLLEGHRWYDLRRYTVCQPYPWSKTIEHGYIYIDNYSIDNIAWYRLEEYDKAYTLPIPREVLDFQNSLGNNDRPARTAFKTEQPSYDDYDYDYDF